MFWEEKISDTSIIENILEFVIQMYYAIRR